MKVIIPHSILGKDLWDSEGKLHLSKDLTRKEAERAKKTFPSIQIIEDKPEYKKQEVKKSNKKVKDSEEKKSDS